MSQPVHYRVTVLPHHHELDVTMTVPPGAGGTPLRLGTPTWVPGDYTFSPYGRDVFAVTATDELSGAPLAVAREGWQGYVIQHRSGPLVISHRAYCSSWEFSEACGILGDRAGVLTGARYLFVGDYDGPCHVTYQLPEGWALHHPSGARQVDAFTWEYPSYLILLDTPVCMGGFEMATSEICGTAFHHVFIDGGVGAAQSRQEVTDPVDAAAARYHQIFESFPFEDYTFVYSCNPKAEWGLEHLTSTMVGLGANAFTDPDVRATGIRAAVHELFHAWNVRRLRPAPLGHLDLIGGNFTEGLWLAEGFTRYYEFLTCTRTHLYTPQQFFSTIVNYYRHLEVLPTYHRVSAVDSSRATYLNHVKKYPGRVNNCIDYYDKGMLIAFGADTLLRLETPDSTLDKAFAKFYARFAGQGAGYSTAAVRDFFDKIHPGLGARVHREATEVAGLDVAGLLGRLGFRVTEEKVPYLGLVLADGKGPEIYGVLDTSPAGASGIAPEDVLTAIDGVTFDSQALEWAIANQDTVALSVARGNQTLTYQIRPVPRSQIGGLCWIGDDRQASLIRSWLDSDFYPTHEQKFPLDFYSNFHGPETVI
ncbi:PDZ domain-containing protein [Mycobacterium sp.]|uniref:M61 family metallopeptidase n=1 Tax=Mycobacterium sp. TaxID=1785 RepID=UPI003BB5DDE7